MALKGKKQTEEHKLRISQANKAFYATHKSHWTGKKRIPHSAWNKGLKISLNTGRTLFVKGIRTSPTTEFKKGIIPWNKGKKLPHLSGVNSPNWIKDRSKLANQELRGCSDHKIWSKSVKNRDGWKCKISNGDCSGRLESHHILGWKSHPDLRYQINNGITLCHFHHPRKHSDEMKLSPYFQKLVISENSDSNK